MSAGRSCRLGWDGMGWYGMGWESAGMGTDAGTEEEEEEGEQVMWVEYSIGWVEF